MGTFQGRNLLSAIFRLKKASRLKQATVKCKSYAKCIFATICQTEAGVTGRASTARWASRRPCGRSRRARRRAATGSAAPTRRKMHFSKILQIFGGLVLGCTKTKFCKKICVRQHFSSSTRCASFRTAAISKFLPLLSSQTTHLSVLTGSSFEPVV